MEEKGLFAGIGTIIAYPLLAVFGLLLIVLAALIGYPVAILSAFSDPNTAR